MSCYYPLKAFDVGNKHPSGKPKLKIMSRGTITMKNNSGKIIEGIDVPCGRCIGCRLDYSREWAIRSYFEAKEYKYNYFVTLTYDNDNLPHGIGNNPQTGEAFVSNTLFSKHLKKFIKDLRRYYEYHYKHIGIRFMASGEYGDKTRRPHYHLILYNLPIYDLKLWKKNFNGDNYYNSPILRKIWGKGEVVIANVTWETSAYVARYVMKKNIGKDNRILYDVAGEDPEFIRHSRNPGLGRAYYERNKDIIYENDEVFVNRSGNVIKSKPVAYYDRLYEKDNPFVLALNKMKRQRMAINHEELVLNEVDLNEFDYSILKKENKEGSIKFLAKNKI